MTTTRALQSSSTLAECRLFTQRYQLLQARGSKSATEQKNWSSVLSGIPNLCKAQGAPKAWGATYHPVGFTLPALGIAFSPGIRSFLAVRIGHFFLFPQTQNGALATTGFGWNSLSPLKVQWCQAVILSQQKSLKITALTASRWPVMIFRTSIIRSWQSHPFLWYCL